MQVLYVHELEHIVDTRCWTTWNICDDKPLKYTVYTTFEKNKKKNNA